MQRLRRVDHCYLTENVMKVLTQNRITTILDLLQEDIEKLATLTKLTLPQVIAIRQEYFRRYSSSVVGGTSLARKLSDKKFVSTGITGLDLITGGGLPIGVISELCGLPVTGKTQVCLQLAINSVTYSNHEVLYIDTKGDFSAVRVQKILHARGYSHKFMAEIMLRIKVIHLWTMDELVELFTELKKGALKMEKLVLIIIDSLPTLMFQFLGDCSKIGLSLLNVFVNHCQCLCRMVEISIVCVNIQTRWLDQDITDVDDDSSVISTKKDNLNERRHRCLGRYWQHIPALVLLTENKINYSENESHHRINLSIIKSSFTKCHSNCELTVNNLGIVD